MGKTTCAAAHAIAAARQGHRVLLVSTDPSHSLGDALGTRLSPRPVRIAAGARRVLFAAELDANRALARWLRQHRGGFGEAIEHGTWLDRQDVDALLELPIPGVDELLGMIEIARITAAGRYTRVVVDTAPTGHTLRLLAAPDTVRVVANVLEALQREHRLVRGQFAGLSGPEAADLFIARLADQAGEAGALLRDAARMAFHWVLLPEELSRAESRDGLAALRAARIAVAELIVNRVLPPGAACPMCDRRRGAEHRMLVRIARGIGREPVVKIAAEQPREPRGPAALARLARTMHPIDLRKNRDVSNAARSFLTSGRGTGRPPLAEVIGDARLIFFGGKGGVGKTTLAAATALALARRDPGLRILLLSTDPAHSLSDVVAAPVDDEARALESGPPNLHVRELDAAHAFALRRVGVEAAFKEIAAAFGPSVVGGPGISELMELAPPGIDELFGMLSVVEALQHYRRIVVDTAPTGHALRLLEIPDAAREWVQLLLRMLLKYRDLVRPGRLARELVDISRSVRQLRELLQDPARTQFLIVTRAAEVPRRETVRLLARLRTLGVTVPALIVNGRTLAPGECRRCRTVARIERRELAALARARRRGECVIIQTPLAAPPPRGVAALDRWAHTWM